MRPWLPSWGSFRLTESMPLENCCESNSARIQFSLSSFGEPPLRNRKLDEILRESYRRHLRDSGDVEVGCAP